MSQPGSVKPSKPADNEIISIAMTTKAEIESKAGRTFTTFKPTEYSTQVVAGINYFVKIDVGGEFIHARIYKDLKQNLSVNKIQTGKNATDPLEYF